MRFEIDAVLFAEAIARVVKVTPRREKSNEICIEATGKKQIVLYRSNTGTYARHLLAARVTEQGKFILGDVRPFAFYRGQLSLFASDKIYVEVGGWGNKAALNLTDTNLDFYEFLDFDGEMRTFSSAARHVLWGTGGRRIGNECVFFAGDKIQANTEAVFSWYDNQPQQIVDKPLAILADTFLLSGQECQLGIDGDRVWISTGDLKMRISTVEVPWSGQIMLDAARAQATIASVKVERDVLREALAYILTLTAGGGFDQGLAMLSLKSGQVEIKALHGQVGLGTRSFGVQACEGESEIPIFPAQYIGALGAMDTDQPLLEFKCLDLAKDTKPTGVLISGERITHGIPRVYVKEVEDE